MESRNYRFTFRASLQKVINEIKEPVDLVTLRNKFIDYWKTHSDPNGDNHLEAYFYRFFPSDRAGEAQVEDFRNPSNNSFSKDFENEFDNRLFWEIISELGYNAAIGRTLEKTGSSAPSFNSGKLKEAFITTSPWMAANMMDSVDEDSFVKFLNGLLHRTRIRGALDHPYLSKFRKQDLKLWDLNWMRDGRHYLSRKYHPKSRIPKIVVNYSDNRGVVDSTFAKTTNWYHAYFRKSFEFVPENKALINEFYENVFKSLESLDIFNTDSAKDGQNYAINPKEIIVSNKVATYQCNKCTSSLNVTQEDAYVEGVSCINYRCLGHYSKSNVKQFNYYNLVYNRENSPRIYASEHTGVLERGVREKTEYDFKERPKYNSLNTLVATSTLEMGIDVGSLNAAINTSIPPKASNFLQRIGRAGRSSGTALITNFAQNKAHDLFYYGEPLEMMEGDINTPGCFLNAKDILIRHFTAYCLDSWTKDDPEKHQIPGLIKHLNLLKVKITSAGFFVNQLLAFVMDNQKELFAAFTKMYDGQIDPTLIESIKSSIQQGVFQQKLLNVFEDLRKEFFFIIQKEKDIEEYIKEKGLGENDDEYKELTQEKKTLWQLKKAIDKRQVIEHLTNVGILPNYAFPETGVTLNAHVYGFKPEGAEQEPENKSFEIVRSASGALKEFAPDNYFYSQGHRLEISGLNTFDWSGEKSSLTTMRFCSNCDHIVDDLLTKKEAACPKCEHESWNSVSNKHKFARLQTVKSVNSRKKSTLNDSKDDREQEHYSVSTHFNFNPNSIEGTWGMKKIPFGIEYVKDVELTKVNLGSGSKNSSHLTINQFEEVARHGFVTCKHCGKSTSKPIMVLTGKTDKKFHYGFCKFREEDYNNIPDDVFEEVFLYRSVKTEALKILLPVQEFQNEATQQMFKAGLQLGLQRYYKGNPDHVAFEFYSEYNIANQRFDRYLVAYDTIPGGTGYLQKLFDPKEFTTLLIEAYNAIKDCSCKNSGKDGCYRCILSYSNQYTREDLSRERAEELFGTIVRASKDWEEINQGISSLTRTGMIEESELERKFVYSLKRYTERINDENLIFKEVKENGTQTYRLRLPIKDGYVTYAIRPQVSLGEKDGLSVSTRPDFVIKCIEIERDGGLVTDIDELLAFKEVAIYLDGYTYHASEKHMRFYEDIVIRNAISETPNMVAWSLSWTDVLLFENEDEEKRTDALYSDGSRYRGAHRGINKFPIIQKISKSVLQTKNSIERLLWYLSSSNKGTLNTEIGMLFASLQDDFAKFAIDEVSAQRLIDTSISVSDLSMTQPGPDAYMKSDLTQANELFKSRIFIRFKDFNMKANIAAADLKVINKELWEEFLRIYTIIKLIK